MSNYISGSGSVIIKKEKQTGAIEKLRNTDVPFFDGVKHTQKNILAINAEPGLLNCNDLTEILSSGFGFDCEVTDAGDIVTIERDGDAHNYHSDVCVVLGLLAEFMEPESYIDWRDYDDGSAWRTLFDPASKKGYTEEAGVIVYPSDGIGSVSPVDGFWHSDKKRPLVDRISDAAEKAHPATKNRLSMNGKAYVEERK